MPGKWLLRLPHPGAPQVVLRVLGHIAGIEWDVLGDRTLILHQGLHRAPLPQALPPRQDQLPRPAFQPTQGMGRGVPVVELPRQPQLLRRRRPLPVHPALRVVVDAEIEVSVGHLAQGTAGSQGVLHGLEVGHPPGQFRGVGAQLWVVFQNGVHDVGLLSEGKMDSPPSLPERDGQDNGKRLTKAAKCDKVEEKSPEGGRPCAP